MRCKACNAVTEKEITDPLTGEDSGLCADCFHVSELVVNNEFIEYPGYLEDVQSNYFIKEE